MRVEFTYHTLGIVSWKKLSNIPICQVELNFHSNCNDIWLLNLHLMMILARLNGPNAEII